MLERHAVELTDGPHRVEVTEQQDLTLGTRGVPFRANVIAALALRQPGDAGADRVEAPHQLGAAAVDGGFVVRRRLETHHRLDRLDQPGALGSTEIAESYN